MASERTGIRVSLSQEVSGTRIEVWLTEDSDFGTGFTMLRRLARRARVEFLKIEMERYWSEPLGRGTLSEKIEDGPQRVAVALFMLWPECKRPIDIQDETGLSSGSVSNILVGRQGDKGGWFERCDEGGWMLSDAGVEEFIADVIPVLPQL